MTKRFRVLEDFESEELGATFVQDEVHVADETDVELAKLLPTWVEQGKVEEVPSDEELDETIDEMKAGHEDDKAEDEDEDDKGSAA
jgi:hypothetical protein